ncbi:hypothetical protein BDQ17DRAFT_161958 [Cyathus striatus]|nr:hypothetical protein BDQ17DRAFT_422552 [Cyathus striatus]KAF8993092.1 hypothetical protein BDQ17DRAFT_161958 [Cyathus striatus]
MSPRPILKSLPPLNEALASSPLPLASCPRILHVHFPPTPALTTTETTHSPFTYDRAPIIVSPNACALPERGGRVYFDTIAKRELEKEPKGSYFHPRAFEASEYERAIDDCTSQSPPSRTFREVSCDSPPPSLTPDMSSESDESDICLSPPLSTPIPRVISKSRNTSYPLYHRRTDTQHHQEVVEQMASTSYPPSLVKDKKHGCKEKCGGKKRDSKLKMEMLRRSLLSFDEAPLDECLSGF